MRVDIGQKFGKLTVIKVYQGPRGGHKAICNCDCGEKNLHRKFCRLLSGDDKSCGCINNPDLTGKRYGKWTVIKKSDRKDSSNLFWLCRCDCGREKSIRTSCLTSGNSKSCGKCGLFAGLNNNRWVARIAVNCETCGKSIPRTPFLIRLHNKHFCDERCYTLWKSLQKGEKNHNWKGGAVYCRHERIRTLSNAYVRSLIRAYGINNQDITREMIELKRQQIKMRRILKQFKQWRKQNESNNSNVHGKQCQDEEDHERKFQYQ